MDVWGGGGGAGGTSSSQVLGLSFWLARFKTALFGAMLLREGLMVVLSAEINSLAQSTEIAWLLQFDHVARDGK